MPSLAIKRAYQDALYWEFTGRKNDQLLVAAPEVLKVRWSNKRREIRDAQGNTIALDAQVVSNAALEPGSLVWLAPELQAVNGETALQQWHGAGSAPGYKVFQVETTDEVPSVKARRTQRSYGLKRYQDYLPNGWHLLRIPDLVAWLNADYNLYESVVGTNPADEDGDSVLRWVSMDRLAKAFTKFSTSSPTLQTADINGKNAVEFSGLLGQNIVYGEQSVSSKHLSLLDDFTVYAAVSFGTSSQSFALSNEVSSNSLIQVLPGNPSVTVTDDNNDSFQHTYTGTMSGNLLFRFRKASGHVYFAGTGMTEVELTSSPLSTHRLKLQSVEGYHHARHVLVFDRALDSKEQRLVEDFLKADLAVELP